MPDILARLNISRCALCGQAAHLKMWRSIPHTVAVSVCTCIRRIAAPHATHCITPPELRGHMEPIGRRLSSGRRGLRLDVAARPRMATKACGTCAHSDKMNAWSGPQRHDASLSCVLLAYAKHPGVASSLQLQVASPRTAGRSMSLRNRPVAQFTAQPDDGMMTLFGRAREQPAGHRRDVGLLSKGVDLSRPLRPASWREPRICAGD
jgi:hypothetical protein